nr:putative ribonuclease H-like domain-containing protein [Tanacetum cinerariifolium]
MRPFGCPVTILNTLDSLNKFDGKVDEGFLVRYSVSSKAFRVFNSRTRIVQETLHVNFLENKPNVTGSGPTWLFDIDTLTKTMNYQPVTAGNQSNPSAGKPEFDEKKPESEVNVSPSSSAQSKKNDDKTKREAKGKSLVKSLTGYRNLSAEFEDFFDNSINEVNATGTLVPTVGQISPNNTNTFSVVGPSNAAASPTHGKSLGIDASQLPDDPEMPELEDITYSNDEDDVGVEADFNNLETSITVSPIPTIIVHKDHHVTQIIGDLSSATQTRSMTRVAKDQGFEDLNHLDKVYKVVKALYGLHQAPRAWYETLANYLLENSFQRGKIDQTLFIKRQEGDILLVQIYKKDGIFISQDKYVAEILRKFRLTDGKSASTPIDTEKPLLKDPDGVNTPRCDEDRLELMKLMVLLLPSDEKVRVEVSAVDLQFWTTVAVKKVNDVTRLQALVDKKNVVVTEAMIRVALRLDDSEGVAEGDDEVHDEGVPAAGIIAEGDVSATNNVVPNAIEEPSIPPPHSPTPPTPPPQPSHDIPSTSQVQPTPRLSPQVQPQSPQPHQQPTQDAGISMNILQELMDTYRALTKRVKHLKLDKIAQALEITKLKQKVKKLEKRNKLKVLKLRRLKRVGSAQRIDTSDDIVMDDVSNQGRMIADMDADADVVLEDAKDVAADAKDDQDADVQNNADIQGMIAESQAKIYKIDMDHANKVLSMQEEESEPIKLQEVVEVVTTAKIITEVVTVASTIITAADVPVPAATTGAAPTLTAAPSRRTKGVVIRDPKESTTTSIIIHSKARSKDKGKGILVEEPKPLKKYQALKRKPQTEAQARKNMMIYLKNVVGFKMDYFKELSYDDIRLIFEKHFDSNMDFLQKTKEQMDEEDSRALKRLNETQEEKVAKKQKLEEEVEELKRHLQIVPNKEDDVYTKATLLARKVLVVDYEIINQNNKPYYKIKRVDGSHQLYLSLLRNFNREDLEAL